VKYLFPNNEPPPEWQHAVNIALRLLARHYPIPCPDRHEWKQDCTQEAYVAIADAALHYACPNPPPADPARHHLLWLANRAYDALRRWWRQEQRYYAHSVPMVVEEEAGEAVELEFEDEMAQTAVLEVLEQVFCAQVLERLSPDWDAQDWAIVAGFAEGKSQAELARELGITQPAVSKCLRRIRHLARGI
jgi:RNA polymerase sigma factor (sigma-70 family)